MYKLSNYQPTNTNKKKAQTSTAAADVGDGRELIFGPESKFTDQSLQTE
jgi:hypothetical protein